MAILSNRSGLPRQPPADGSDKFIRPDQRIARMSSTILTHCGGLSGTRVPHSKSPSGDQSGRPKKSDGDRTRPGARRISSARTQPPKFRPHAFELPLDGCYMVSCPASRWWGGGTIIVTITALPTCGAATGLIGHPHKPQTMAPATSSTLASRLATDNRAFWGARYTGISLLESHSTSQGVPADFRLAGPPRATELPWRPKDRKRIESLIRGAS